MTDTNCTAVLRTHPQESGKTSADWFMRNFHNLTFDVGNNPAVDGIRWYGNNTSLLKNIRVTGHGRIGINSGFMDQSGPNLIQDTEIDGFDTGILSQWIWSETLSRVTIRNCRSNGVVVAANVVAIEGLVVENTPVTIQNEVPNDGNQWGGVVTLVGGRFTGSNPEHPAIVNKSILFARDVKTRGFKMALQSSTPSGNVEGNDIGEYSSSKARYLFDPHTNGLHLAIKSEPDFFDGTPAVLENRSKSKTLVVGSCDFRILGTGQGDIFVTDCSSHLDLRQAVQRCWARQLNQEGNS